MNEEVAKLIQKSKHALEVSKTLSSKGYISDASSKIYYAMFYAARALLVSGSIDVSKHSAVEAAFGFHYVKPGKIDSKYHKMLIEARKVREIADYGFEDQFLEDEPAITVSDGEAFLSVVKHLLNI